MKITFTQASWLDYLWLQENDKKLLKRVNLLMKIYRVLSLHTDHDLTYK